MLPRTPRLRWMLILAAVNLAMFAFFLFARHFDRIVDIYDSAICPAHDVTPAAAVPPYALPPFDQCDPYNEPGYFNASDHIYNNTTFIALDPDCQPLARGDIFHRMRNREDLPRLVNKTIALFGDSVDRRQVVTICDAAGGQVQQTYQEDHRRLWNTTAVPESPNCFPRVCTVPHYNLTISIYFMYGFDPEGIWRDRKEKFWEPQVWTERVDLFMRTALTLGRGAPDLVFFNFGLWELARLDRLASWAHLPESMSFNEEQLAWYRSGLTTFAETLRTHFPHAAVVYRETHYTLPAGGAYTAIDMPGPYRYATQKIDQLNHVAAAVMRRNNVAYWPMGQLTRGLPKRELLSDDVHPNKRSFLNIWGPGIMEYIMRAPLTDGASPNVAPEYDPEAASEKEKQEEKKEEKSEEKKEEKDEKKEEKKEEKDEKKEEKKEEKDEKKNESKP